MTTLSFKPALMPDASNPRNMRLRVSVSCFSDNYVWAGMPAAALFRLLLQRHRVSGASFRSSDVVCNPLGTGVLEAILVADDSIGEDATTQTGQQRGALFGSFIKLHRELMADMDARSAKLIANNPPPVEIVTCVLCLDQGCMVCSAEHV